MTTEVKPEPAKGTAIPEVKPEVIVPPAPAPTADQLAELLKQNNELKEENKKRRLHEKETAATNERVTKALALLTGKTDDVDPVKLKEDQSNAKIRRAYLKAEFVVEAKEMHDASFAFAALESELKDVKVDIDTGEVDRTALKSVLGEVKKKSPFLFATPGAPTPPVKPAGNPDGGQPTGAAGSPFQKWVDLKQQPGRAAEAQKFYSDNRLDIMATMPK
jgi:hypothetical protein